MNRFRTCAMSLLAAAVMPSTAAGQVIDMHLHAAGPADQGPPPLAMCTPIEAMPNWDQRRPYPEAIIDFFKNPKCENPIWSPETDKEMMNRTIAEMHRHHVHGVLSGPIARLKAWDAAAPGRFWFGLLPHDEMLADAEALKAAIRPQIETGKVGYIGEIGVQYAGIGPDDARLDGLWAAAEAFDVPVAIHIGVGPPGAAYLPGSRYRVQLTDPLALEPVLIKHPRLRVQVMHAGYPMLDQTIALLYGHPQVHVDVGVIVYTQPRPEFYRYLKALVDAGFTRRILFGSDQMIWPEAIGRSIAVIEEAPFLSEGQKRDILYNNAARFLRLDAATIARHHQGAGKPVPPELQRDQ